MNERKIRTILTAEEGYSRKAYQDSKGYWTIGIGHCLEFDRGMSKDKASLQVWSDERIAQQFSEDIRTTSKALVDSKPWISDLPEVQNAVLLCMAFQMGSAGVLGFRRTLNLVQAGKYEEASASMAASKWARQDTPARAARMVEMMRTGMWLAWHDVQAKAVLKRAGL